MRANKRSTLLPVALLTGAILFVGGCRTYGGYGSEEAIYSEILEANRQFEADLGRANGELAALRQAAGRMSGLDSLVNRFENVTELHQQLLEGHRALAEEVEGAGHRYIFRVFGAIQQEQQLVRTRYAALTWHLGEVVDSASFQTAPFEGAWSYRTSPLYYHRLANSNIPAASALVRQSGAPASGTADTADVAGNAAAVDGRTTDE